MTARTRLVSDFNRTLEAYHAAGLFAEIMPITEAMLNRWIATGGILDLQYYSPGMFVPQILELLNQAPGVMAADKRWSPRTSRDSRQIHLLRSLGKSIRDIANQAGCSESTVKRRLRAPKGSLIRAMGGNLRLRHLTIQALYEDGWGTKQEIAEQLGVSERTVRRALKEELDKRVIL